MTPQQYDNEVHPDNVYDHEPESSSGDTPFLSVLVRTSGQRLESLDETLLSLLAQTDTDFEVIILADAAGDELDVIRAQLAEHPATLRERIVVVRVGGSPAQVLNAGVAAASGIYVTLSDDITWLGQWVETTKATARAFPGRCVRGLVLEQEVCIVEVGGEPGLRALSAPVRAGGPSFSLAEHVKAPLASTYGHAIPRSLFTDLGVTFDESSGTASVRRHLLRAVELVGLVELGEVVAVHQRHVGLEMVENADDLARLVEAIDSAPYLLPTGSASGALAARTQSVEEITTRDHLIALKDDHIANLEQMLGASAEKVARLDGRLERRDTQVQKLRARIKKIQGAEEIKPANGPKGSRRFPFRS